MRPLTIAWDKHIKVFQLVGALLAIPAGVAGTYSVYHTYMSGGVSCSDLRNSIIATLDRNIAPEAKNKLLRADVGQFEKNCGEKDPDAKTIFQAAIAPVQPTPQPTQAAKPVAIFGLSRSGEKRGWVPLFRRSEDQKLEAAFDGYPITPGSLPPPGTLLTSRALVPVWLQPHPPGQNDPTQLQGRLAPGTCVRVLGLGPAPTKLWAEVRPEACE
jgi:hypothetical protein